MLCVVCCVLFANRCLVRVDWCLFVVCGLFLLCFVCSVLCLFVVCCVVFGIWLFGRCSLLFVICFGHVRFVMC